VFFGAGGPGGGAAVRGSFHSTARDGNGRGSGADSAGRVRHPAVMDTTDSSRTTASATAPMTVGFVGIGIMGEPMAGHLARAGHRLRIVDRAPEGCARLAGAHASVQVCATPAEAARGADVVITMLPDGQVVREVAFGEHGLHAGLDRGALLLDTSSAEPWITRETAARLASLGVAMVDAPVSGARWGAEAAELVFMVGGASDDVARVRPLLDAMGHTVFHLGPTGSGHAMKCLNNMVTAMNLLALSEGLAIGTRYGLDPAVMADVIDASTAGSWVARTHVRQRVLNRAFDDPFRLELMLKDVGIGLGVARAAGVPAPFAGLGEQLWRTASVAAGPGASVSELVRWVESLSGTEIRSPR